MSQVQTYLNYIMTKTYGEEVCQAICDAILTCYNDVSSPTLNREGFTAVLNEMAANGSLADGLMSYLSILTEDTSNKFNLLTAVIGRLNTSTGEVNTESTTYITTDWIPVDAGDLVYFDNCSDKVFYNTSKVKQAAISQSGATAYTVPSGGGYIRASSTQANRGVAKINIGTRTDYVPGRSSVDYNLRSDVYTKSEIDSMIDGVDISLTQEQIDALIGLLD